MARCRESTPLQISEVQTPAAQVLFEDAVLFPQGLDDFELVPIHPSRQCHEDDPQPHRVDHEPSLFVGASASPGGALS